MRKHLLTISRVRDWREWVVPHQQLHRLVVLRLWSISRLVDEAFEVEAALWKSI